MADKKPGARIPRDTNRSRQPNLSQFVTKKAVHGSSFTPGTNPPNITYQPWYPLTVAYVANVGANKDESMTPVKLAGHIKLQLDPKKTGLADAPTLQMRILSIRCRNLTGRTIAFSVDDYADMASAIDARDQA